MVKGHLKSRDIVFKTGKTKDVLIRGTLSISSNQCKSEIIYVCELLSLVNFESAHVL